MTIVCIKALLELRHLKNISIRLVLVGKGKTVFEESVLRVYLGSIV